MARRYKETDKMSDLICRNYLLLQAMSRFGLPLGFGDKTVRAVCEQNNVDCNTFLTVVQFIEEETIIMGEDDAQALSVSSLIDYLKRAHSYFLDFNLPTIRRKLIEALDYSGEHDIAMLILRYYDEYVKEVRKHMEYEDKVVFGYVSMLQKGEKQKDYSIDVFVKRHNQIEDKLSEFKNIIIKYYPGKVNNNLLNSVLFDIFSCEQDLSSHCKAEDYLFVPAVRRLEKEIEKDEK